MSIWINKKNDKTIHSTGKHWVNNACVSAPVCREREKGEMGADMFTAARTCDRVSLTVPIWLFPLCFVLHLVCPRKAISSSQNKSIASRRMLCLQAWRFVWAFWGCMYSEGWTEMGHIFSWKCGSVNFLLPYICKTWAHLPWKARE